MGQEKGHKMRGLMDMGSMFLIAWALVFIKAAQMQREECLKNPKIKHCQPKENPILK